MLSALRMGLYHQGQPVGGSIYDHGLEKILPLNILNKNNSILQNWSLLTSASFIQTGLNFLSLVRIARILSPVDYGRYIFFLTVVTIAQVIVSLGLRNISIREIARNPHALPFFAHQTSKIILLATVFIGSLLVLFLHTHEEIRSSLLLLEILFFLIAQASWDFAETLAFGLSQMRVSALLSIISALAWLVVVWSLPAPWMILEVVFGAFVTVQVLRSCIYLGWEWRAKYFLLTDLSRNYYVRSRELLRQSLPILGTNLLSLPVSQLPLMFLASYSGMNQVAYFGIGNKLTQPIQIVLVSIFPAILPMLSVASSKDPELFKKQIEKLFMILSFLGITIATLVSLFGNEIILLLFGDKYFPAILPLSFQLWIAIQSVLFGLIGLIFIVMNQERTMIRLSLVNATLIGCSAYVGSHYGALGISLALLVSGALGFIIHWYFLGKIVSATISLNKQLRVFFSYGILCTVSALSMMYSLEYRMSILLVACLVLSILFKQEIFHMSALIRNAKNNFFQTMEAGLNEKG
jgi:O-antigen/teichoic acid export membrane protein